MPGWVSAQGAGGVEALGGVGRRHADVDHHGVRRIGVHGGQQRLRVADPSRDREAGLPEQQGEALPEQRGVVGERNPQGGAGGGRLRHGDKVGEVIRPVKHVVAPDARHDARDSSRAPDAGLRRSVRPSR